MKNKSRRIRKLSRPLRHALAYFFIKLMLTLVSHLPLAWSQTLGRTLGLFCAKLLSKYNQLIKRQLEQTLLKDSSTALGNHAILTKHEIPLTKQYSLKRKTNYDCKRLMRAHWRDLGQRLFEWLSAKKALGLFHITPEQRDQLLLLQERSNSGKAQVIMSAHFAHWELMAAYLSQQGFSYIAIASALPKGPFGAWLSAYRKELGIEVVHPHGGAKIIRKTLKRGGIVALLIDHSTYERSIEAHFLGKKAPFSLTADRLIAGFDAEVHWLSNYRNEQGQYHIILQKLSRTKHNTRNLKINTKSSFTLSHKNVSTENSESLDNKELSQCTYTILAHQLLEKQIRHYPEQWLWLHQKWTARQSHYQ